MPRSKNCFQVVTGSVTTFVRTVIPVVPQSFGRLYSSFGSHHCFLNAGLMYLTFGTFDQSIFWMKSSASRVGTRVGGRGRHVVLADVAALQGW